MKIAMLLALWAIVRFASTRFGSDRIGVFAPTSRIVFTWIMLYEAMVMAMVMREYPFDVCLHANKLPPFASNMNYMSQFHSVWNWWHVVMFLYFYCFRFVGCRMHDEGDESKWWWVVWNFSSGLLLLLLLLPHYCWKQYINKWTNINQLMIGH